MKTFLPAVPIALFPYSILLIIYCMFFNTGMMKVLFGNDIFRVLLFLGIFWLAALVCSGLLFAGAADRGREFLAPVRVAMVLKLVQVPAYLVIFGVGLLCRLTVFTMALSFLLLCFDMASILLSGLVGLGAVRRCRQEGILTGRETVLYAVLQFVPCVDAVSVVLLFHRTKAAGQREAQG